MGFFNRSNISAGKSLWEQQGRYSGLGMMGGILGSVFTEDKEKSFTSNFGRGMMYGAAGGILGGIANIATAKGGFMRNFRGLIGNTKIKSNQPL